ncbi:MAG: alpha/beta hydrolase [Candidatus Aminicenantes bacterium]|nr:alpha/beta hydrolase [Candidatus Aminicenantes bacterium]
MIGQKWKTFLCIVILAAGFASCDSKTEDVSDTPVLEVTISGTEVHMISSSFVGQEFKILVALPHKYKESDRTYPVLYVLDANGTFGMMTETVRLLNFTMEMCDMIIVGLGYPVNSFREAMSLRARDYTPSEDEDTWGMILKFVPEAPPSLGTGGAKKFLNFMREELFPFIDANFRTKPDDRILAGSSFGGLFSLYTLFHQPDTFNRYIIGSPSIWWDKEITFTYESEYAKNHSDLPARVFISVGSLEEREGNQRDAELAMVSNMHRLAKILRERNYPNLRLTTHVFEDETHISVTPATLSRGIRMVYQVKK